ncbi:DUF222 domain-containing protein [Kribbella sp. NPDC054772]
MEILGERPVWSMSGGEMVSTLDATYAEIARLETLALHLTAGLETIGYAKDVGAGTTARFLTFRYRIDATKARRDVHLANALSKYPAVADALPDPNPDHDPETTHSDTGEGDVGEGDVGGGVLLHPAQAEAIVSALDKLPTTVPVEDLAVAEREMVELGRTHGPLDLRKAATQIRDRLDTDGPEPAEQKAYDRETLRLKTADNGVTFSGFLANENAELFRTLIHTHAKPHKTIDGALDPRSRDKRQADALTTILGGTNAHNTYNTGTSTSNLAGDRTAGAGTPENATGSADDSATSARSATRTGGATRAGANPAAAGGATRAGGAAGSGGAAGAGGASPARAGHGVKPHITVTIDFNDLKAAAATATGQLIYGGNLSAATIRRLACDAHILPIVLGSDSQPLDVGTTVRLATGPIRKALITRDKGCVCCGAPPIYCDAHHVTSWIDGGETKINNLVLLCKRCHRDLHAGSWDIHITNGIVHVTRPTWATPDRVPRGKYRPPTAATTSTATTPSSATPAADTPGAATPGAGTPRADMPGAGTPGAGLPGLPARVWPRDTDPPWISAEDAARLNPWGDAPDERPARTRTHPPAADFDPWGDGGSSIAQVDPHSDLSPSTTVAFDPWGDLAAVSGDNECSPADGSKLDPCTADGWHDSAEARTTTAA